MCALHTAGKSFVWASHWQLPCVAWEEGIRVAALQQRPSSVIHVCLGVCFTALSFLCILLRLCSPCDGSWHVQPAALVLRNSHNQSWRVASSWAGHGSKCHLVDNPPVTLSACCRGDLELS